jgi:hypothetical protein
MESNRSMEIPLVCVLLAACGSAPSQTPDGGSDVDASGIADSFSPEISVTAVSALPPLSSGWNWVDEPLMGCDDGTPTGFGVNPGTSDDVLVYFEGGGACWSYETCFVLNTSEHGPFAQAQWDATVPRLVGPFDRSRGSNPFQTWTYVFVPYCTGDLHAGTSVVTYAQGSASGVVHHVGRLNAEVVLARVAATWPRSGRVVVAGTSAGGYGATLNYDLFRGAFPSAQMAMLDDAAPLLEGAGVPPALRTMWYTSWNLGDLIQAICADCVDDLSLLYSTLSTRYPRDRFALLSSLEDASISTHLLLSGTAFETDLRALATERFDPTANARVFFVPGAQHGLLADEATLSGASSSGTVTLDAWLSAMLGGASWSSVEP